MGEHDAVAGDAFSSVSSLAHDLRALGLGDGALVLVHSSLKSLGWVAGGAQAVVMALQEVIGYEGTLVMPTSSAHLSEPSHWVNPPVPASWWPRIRAEMPAYDPHLTPTRGMGAIVECFRAQPDVIRSAHPQFSFAARGPQAAEVTGGQTLAFMLDDESPLGKLHARDASVLLLGTGFASCTSLHLAEYRADYPAKVVHREAAPILVDGERQWVEFDDVDLDGEDFPEIGAAYVAAGLPISIGRVGRAESHLMPMRSLVDFAVEWLPGHRIRPREGERPRSARRP